MCDLWLTLSCYWTCRCGTKAAKIWPPLGGWNPHCCVPLKVRGEMPLAPAIEEKPKWRRRAVIPRSKEKNGLHIYSFLPTFIVVWDWLINLIDIMIRSSITCLRIDDLSPFFSGSSHSGSFHKPQRSHLHQDKEESGKKCTTTLTNQRARLSHFNKSCICPSSY